VVQIGTGTTANERLTRRDQLWNRVRIAEIRSVGLGRRVV